MIYDETVKAALQAMKETRKPQGIFYNHDLGLPGWGCFTTFPLELWKRSAATGKKDMTLLYVVHDPTQCRTDYVGMTAEDSRMSAKCAAYARELAAEHLQTLRQEKKAGGVRENPPASAVMRLNRSDLVAARLAELRKEQAAERMDGMDTAPRLLPCGHHDREHSADACDTCEDMPKGKAVRSTDPRKPAIMEALKKASDCSKVTNVVQVDAHAFVGRCMKPARKNGGRGCEYVSAGYFLVNLPTVSAQ
jgi:hypothetical protein